MEQPQQKPLNENENEPVVMERVIENDNMAFCSAIALLVLGIFPLNGLSFLMGIFALVALSTTYEAWRTWKRVVQAFYYINLVMCSTAGVVGVIIIVVGGVKRQGELIGAGVVLIVFAGIVWFLARRTNYGVDGLYSTLNTISEDTRNDKVYGGNVAVDVTTNTQVP